MLVPILIACFAIVSIAPIVASQGVLHIPGYCGVALVALAVGLAVGKIAEAQTPGSLPGIYLSIVFLLAMAACLGSILAIFSYREPES